MLTLVPWVLVTKVFPTLREVKLFGALTSYQSFFAKGSALHEKNIVLLSCSRGYAVSSQPTSAGDNTHAFFLPPFLPFEILLFLPTAMLGNRPSPHTQKREYCKLGAWFNAPTAALGWGCPPTPTKSPSGPQSSTLQTFQPMSMSSNFNIER